jgi:bacterioferritin-associated ferredoxin
MRAELLQAKTCGNCDCDDAAAVTANAMPVAAE